MCNLQKYLYNRFFKCNLKMYLSLYGKQLLTGSLKKIMCKVMLCYNMNYNKNYIIKSGHYDVNHNRNYIMTSIYSK